MQRASGTEPAPARLIGFEEDDPRDVRWALAIAIGLHVVLFSLHLPEMSLRAEDAPAADRYIVMPAPRFAPEPPAPEELIPRELRRRIPIPDPTPEQPEPIRPAAEIEVPVALTGSDVVFGIPAAPPAPEVDTAVRVGGDVLPPKKIHAPAPRYPELARKARIQDTVIVEAIIDADGRVRDTRVIKPAPMGLDQAAVDAVSRWRFEPATLRGRPVAVVYSLAIRFTLQ